MKQTDINKLNHSQEILLKLKEARGGSLLESHLKMGNDPYLAKMFLDSYENNKADSVIPRKYKELMVMAIGMATGTSTTMNVHANLAVKNGATVDEICEVIRMIFFTCGVTKLLPILEQLNLEAIDLNEA
ncbi:MAG: carboxymuconolactone decarboxylase family protein [Oscillospiraceae bacterium]|nr:carboxymuconolactone decarboxylase family protein [Oscillospiraceae bacterium]